jgi:hypothetical protein
MIAIIWGERGGICIKCLHSRTTVNSVCYIETLWSIYSSPHFVYFKQYMFEALLSHYNARPHISMHTIETIADFGWTVLSYLSYCCDLASSDFHFGPLKGSWQGHHYNRWCGTAELCAPVAAEQGERLFFLQKFMLLFKGGRRLLSNVWTMLKNNYTFSSVVVNFCGMFMFVACKQHEIEDRRHYFLTITFWCTVSHKNSLCQHTTCPHKILNAYVSLKTSVFVFMPRD